MATDRRDIPGPGSSLTRAAAKAGADMDTIGQYGGYAGNHKAKARNLGSAKKLLKRR